MAAASREKTVHLLCTPQTNGVGIFSVSAGSKTSFYTFREVACEIGGRGFAVHRLGLGALYHVRIGAAEECSCECMGFLRHGRCKHLLALLSLSEGGHI